MSNSRYAVAESLSFWSGLRNMVRAEYGTWNNYTKKEYHIGKHYRVVYSVPLIAWNNV